MKIIISEHQLYPNQDQTHLLTGSSYVSEINPDDEDIVIGMSEDKNDALVFDLSTDLSLVEKIIQAPMLSNDLGSLLNKDCLDGTMAISLGYKVELVDASKKVIKKIKTQASI